MLLQALWRVFMLFQDFGKIFLTINASVAYKLELWRIFMSHNSSIFCVRFTFTDLVAAPGVREWGLNSSFWCSRPMFAGDLLHGTRQDSQYPGELILELRIFEPIELRFGTGAFGIRTEQSKISCSENSCLISINGRWSEVNFYDAQSEISIRDEWYWVFNKQILSATQLV